jgi:tetratricopeptide (TPR) repeat protein
MKIKRIIITGSLLVSMVAFSQKDELKTLKKIYTKEKTSPSDVSDYKATIIKLESLANEESDKVYLNFYKANVPQIELASLGTVPTSMQLQKTLTPKIVTEIATATKATLEFESKSGKKILTEDINNDIAIVNPILINMAMELAKAKKEADAATVMNAVYLFNTTNLDNLFYAASFAVNANDYDNALKYYQELKAKNYSGEGVLYYAYNKTIKQEEFFNTKALRDSFVKLGSHEKPRDEKIPSKRGEIYRNIALILVNKGKNEEAKQAFIDARKANPNDDSLLVNEANLYLTLNDFDTYTRLVNEALQKDPNNSEMYFNLGVVSANAKKLDVAEGYYKKAIEIDANYFNAYINLAELKMRSDDKFVEQINKLGTTDKELKQYEVLKTERNKNFQAILPLLEKAIQIKPEDNDAKKALLSIYRALEMSDKAKELKAKMN